ncbi:SMI1/KNR4 family protein [Chitinophaga sp. 30R24]|uniref:SMI1/KNR4 family protein n=1 Tax=Chitinophaga sp. 30R24 TaxID=3248838 RepID=UPI003B91675A
MLEEFEKEYGFTYPTLYKQLYKDGMLNWGEFGENWLDKVYPAIRTAPPLLLYANDLEIMDLATVSEEMEDGFLFADPVHRFVPFAVSSGGDWFAFYFNLQQEEDVPIVQVYRDANEACILAKNLQDFIFLQMLEAITDLGPESPSLITYGDLKENCGNFLRTHSPYLTPHQATVVATVYETGKLTNVKLHEIVEQEMNFQWLDSSFPYQLRD